MYRCTHVSVLPRQFAHLHSFPVGRPANLRRGTSTCHTHRHSQKRTHTHSDIHTHTVHAYMDMHTKTHTHTKKDELSDTTLRNIHFN